MSAKFSGGRLQHCAGAVINKVSQYFYLYLGTAHTRQRPLPVKGTCSVFPHVCDPSCSVKTSMTERLLIQDGQFKCKQSRDPMTLQVVLCVLGVICSNTWSLGFVKDVTWTSQTNTHFSHVSFHSSQFVLLWKIFLGVKMFFGAPVEF